MAQSFGSRPTNPGTGGLVEAGHQQHACSNDRKRDSVWKHAWKNCWVKAASGLDRPALWVPAQPRARQPQRMRPQRILAHTSAEGWILFEQVHVQLGKKAFPAASHPSLTSQVRLLAEPPPFLPTHQARNGMLVSATRKEERERKNHNSNQNLNPIPNPYPNPYPYPAPTAYGRLAFAPFISCDLVPTPTLLVRSLNFQPAPTRPASFCLPSTQPPASLCHPAPIAHPPDEGHQTTSAQIHPASPSFTQLGSWRRRSTAPKRRV